MMPISRNRYQLLLGITCDVECIHIGFYAFYVAMKGYVYSGFNENLLKQLKTRIKKHKINKLCDNWEWTTSQTQ